VSDLFDVRRARMNLGLTQRDLAAKCGVSLTTIQRFEGGAAATPANAKKVADFFGVLVTDLMPVERTVA
jgi:transcriptional regulator with XRE-family HTH domain